MAAKIRRVLSAFGLVLGLCILAAPSALEIYNRYKAEQVITSLEDKLDVSSDPNRLMYLEQARAYNARMAGNDYALEGELLPYDDQLSWKGKPYMAYIHIPDIDLKLPIYHGTAEAELAMGVGHLEGTSLPVGGEPSTCVLEGHSGLQTARMFDDIRELDVGDMLCVWTLSEPYAYEVTSWEILSPEEVVPFIRGFSEGDKVLLVTCTTTPDAAHPRGRIGVNDKRLVVVCDRCEYIESYFAEPSVVESLASNSRLKPGLIALGISAIVVLIVVTSKRRSRKKGGSR